MESHGSVIVLEDDLVTSPFFLSYMNKALDKYRDSLDVASVHGYLYPINNMTNVPDAFFIKGADCWGWATWDRAWKIFEPDGEKLLAKLKNSGRQREADFNGSYGYSTMLRDQIRGKNDSWAIRWYMSCFLQDKVTLYPKKSYVQNIGNDDSGTHCSQTDQFFIAALNNEVVEMPEGINILEDYNAKKHIENYFRDTRKSVLRKLINKLKKSLLS